MVCDYEWQCLSPLRAVINTAISPIQIIVDFPAVALNWTTDNLITRKELLHENAQLKAERVLLEVNAQKIIFLERQNNELRALLGLTQKINGKYITAEIMAVDAHHVGQQVIVNKGENFGVYIGQPVVDAYGVIGQVIMVNSMNSRVMLVTDSKSAVPVINTRNGMRAIAVGVNDQNMLELAHVPDTADVKKGDILVTSGIGLQLPAGYLVGVVESVGHTVGERFAKVVVTPYARVNSSRYVLLLWSDTISDNTDSSKHKSKITRQRVRVSPRSK